MRKRAAVIILICLFNINLILSPIIMSTSFNVYSQMLKGKYSNVKINLSSLDFSLDQRFILTLDSSITIEEQLSKIEQVLGQPLTTHYVFSSFKGVCVSLTKSQVNDLSSLSFIKSIIKDEKFQMIDPMGFSGLVTAEPDIDLGKVTDLINSSLLPYTGAGVKIAILDTGIYKNHLDFSGRVTQEKSFVTNQYGWAFADEEGVIDLMGHGTHVAGIAAGSGAASPTGYDCQGVAPGAELINAKCLDRIGDGSISSVVAAIEWAANTSGADIISMSLGFPGEVDPDHPISLAVDDAVSQGVIVVVAAGNEGPFYLSSRAPGNARRVITVGASNSSNQLASFSSRGPTTFDSYKPNVVAPGVNMYSALAEGTVLQAISTRTRDAIGAGNRYMPLSGTSMAAPVVAGAVALLLDAFPSLSPEAAKIALMETTINLTGNLGPNAQGAGLINVTAAHELLNQTLNISAVFPKLLPAEPFDILSFPGNSEDMRIELLKSYSDNFTITIPSGLRPFLSFENLTAHETLTNSTSVKILETTNYSEVILNVWIPPNTTPNIYQGKLQVHNSSSLVHEIFVNLAVRTPFARVYFDGFHNEDATDSFRSNYYDVIKNLSTQGWDINLYETIITRENLNNYDVLMLPDIEVIFTPEELNAIQDFYQDGGSILILGAGYPDFARSQLNNLLALLNSGISLTTQEITWEFDYGIGRDLESFLISDIVDHPITNGVTSFTWLIGQALSVDPSNATVLARSGSLPVLAVSSNSNNGSLVVYGAERHFYGDLYDSDSNSRLISQTFDWLLENKTHSDQRNVSIQVIPNATTVDLNEVTQMNASFHAWDHENSTSIDDLSIGTNLTVSLARWNSSLGDWNSIWQASANNVTFLGSGVYEISMNFSEIGQYRINVSIQDSFEGFGFFKVINETIKIQALNMSRTQNKAGGSYSQTDLDLYRQDDRLLINLTIEHDAILANNMNVTAFLSSISTGRKDNLHLAIALDNSSSLDSMIANFTTDISFTSNQPAGTYALFIFANDSAGNVVASDIETFVINNEVPVAGASSTINGIPFSLAAILTPMTYYGGSLYISASGQDPEDSTSQIEAWVVLTNIIIDSNFIAYAYEIIMAQKLSYLMGSFQGNLVIPLSGMASYLDVRIPLLEDMYAVIVILIDSDGDYDTESQLMALINIIPIPSTVFFAGIIAIIIVIIVSLTLLATYIIRRRRRTTGVVAKPSKVQRKMIVCPYCGKSTPMALDLFFCINCGQKIRSDGTPESSSASMDDVVSDLKDKYKGDES